MEITKFGNNGLVCFAAMPSGEFICECALSASHWKISLVYFILARRVYMCVCVMRVY